MRLKKTKQRGFSCCAGLWFFTLVLFVIPAFRAGASYNYTATPTTGPAPLAVNFSAPSSDGLTLLGGWSWSFGDGGTSSAENPSYTYAQAGTYSPVLTVYNLLGVLSDTATGPFINVTPALSITPNSVGNSYVGTVSLQVSGLIDGTTILVQKYLDVNSNGIVDAGDWLVQQYQITDGVGSPVIAGVTNINVPGDENPTNGVITKKINLSLGGPEQYFVAQYLYVISSPTGAFPPVTNFFNVTNASYAQSFNGNVICNGTNVPHAFVWLLGPPRSTNSGLNLISGTVANASGYYSIQAPAGTYQLLPSASNFIANVGTAPVLALGADTAINTNLLLNNTTERISGSLVDAATTNLGLPGVLMAATIQGGLAAFGSTDSTGKFTIPVLPGHFEIGEEQLSLAIHGYVGLNNDTNVDATAGSVAGVTIAFPKATALLYGSVTDTNGNPLPGVQIEGDNGTNGSGAYQGEAATDQNGHYVVAVVAGNWDASVDDKNPAYSGYDFCTGPSWSYDSGGNGTNISAGMAVESDFAGIAAPYQINGSVTDEDTADAIVGVEVYAYITVGSNYFNLSADTDANGNYSFNAFNGNWDVGVNCNGGTNSLAAINYQCIGDLFPVISGSNASANFQVQPVGGGIPTGFDFTATPTNALAGFPVQFQGPTNDSLGNPIISWSWDFGDGGINSNQNVTYVYENPGFYIPALEIVNNDGGSAEVPGPSIVVAGGTFSPTVLELTPAANSYLTLVTGESASMQADSIEGTPPFRYQWSLNGTDIPGATNIAYNINSAGPSDAGSYSLIVSNPYGTNVAGPIVAGLLGTAQFTASPTIGGPPLTVYFQGPSQDSYGNPILSWSWSFGGGSGGSTNQNPTNIYYEPDFYAPTVTVTTAFGTITATGPSITVAEGLIQEGMVVNGGFETGDFTGWNLSGDGQTVSSTAVHSGEYADQFCSRDLSFISQTLPTTPGATYLLSFWLDSPDGETPNEFLASWNGQTLMNDVNLPALGWTNFQFVVTATQSNTVLLLGGQDDYSSLYLDDVDVESNFIQFTATPTTGLAPLTVQFNATNIDTLGNAITSWSWSFNDGCTSTNQNPTHTYTNIGSGYYPTLQAVNSLGAPIPGFGPTVTVQAPSVQISVTPTAGAEPLTVSFSASNTDTYGNPIIGSSWNFGDHIDPVAQDTTHIYENEGIFIPVLTATNSNGLVMYIDGPPISVAPFTGLVQNSDFMSDDFTGWNLTGDVLNCYVDFYSESSGVVTNGNDPFFAVLETQDTYGYLSQNLATVPGQTYLVSFALNGIDASSPNEFLMSWNGDTLFDATNFSSSTWTNIQQTIMATSTNTVLQFGFLANNGLFALDNVTVEAITPPCVAPPSGLVSWWPAEGNALDIVGGNDGVLTNVGFAAAEVGQGFDFTNVDSAVLLGTPANLRLQNFTIEGWIQRASTEIVTEDTNAYAGNALFFSFGQGGYGFGLFPNGSLDLTMVNVDNLQSAASVPDTNLHHVAVTKNGTTVTFYVDGVAYAADGPDNDTFQFTTPAAIGARGDNAADNFTGQINTFLGVIDELSIYSRALSANEIASIYSAGSGGKCADELPPYIFNPPANQVVTAGNTATFTVAASGATPLSFQWQFNGTNLTDNCQVAGSQSSTLTLSNALATNAGTYQIIVSNGYGIAESSAILTVSQATPVITWATPAAIISGTALGSNQLDATASVPGSFAYTPNTNAVLPPGNNTLSVVFTPTDTVDYYNATNSVELNVIVPVVSDGNDDSGASSLRNLISALPSGATLTFASNLSGATILLTNGEILLSNNITIDGSSLSNGITFNGNSSSRIFEVTSNATVTLNSLTITGGSDTTGNGGGGILNAGTLNINDSTFSGNSSADGGGGAIASLGSLANLNMVDCTVANNNAAFAAIWSHGGAMNLTFCTVSLNTGSEGTGGVVLEDGPDTLFDSIVAGNTGTVDPDIGGSGATVSLTGTNLIGQPSSVYYALTSPGMPDTNGQLVGSAADPLNPDLAPLGNYGGPTQTMPPLPGSLAIDAALANGLMPVTDQRGLPRVSGPGPDIGAVELAVPVAPILTWATPAPVIYGTALSSNQLNATADVPGTFVYSPTNGTVPPSGNDTLTVTFTPSNTVDYSSTSTNVILTVLGPGTNVPLVVWTNPAPIPYGTPLGSNQLDATASVPGVFLYSPASGAELNQGTNTLTAIFTPSNTITYANTTNTVSLNVTLGNLVVAPSNAVRLLGAANPTFGGAITGTNFADGISAVYSCAATAGSPAGTYPITAALLDPNHRLTNYNVTLNIGTLTISSGVILTSPANGQSFSNTAAIPFSATATLPAGVESLQLYANSVAVATDPATNSISTVLSNLPTGGYRLTAVATDSNSQTYSQTVYVTVNAPGSTLIDFDPLDTTLGVMNGAPLASYLSTYGVTASNVSFGTSLEAANSLEAVNQNGTSSNEVPVPSSLPNLFTQVGSTQPVTFTLNFASPLQSFGFTRVGLDTNGSTVISHPAWSAHILDAFANELESVSEPLLLSSSNILPRTFTLIGSNIASVRFDSDSQSGTAAFAAVLLDDLVLGVNETNNPLSISLAQPAGGTAPANIALSATAADTLTNINYVAFYSGPTLIGIVSNSPYHFTWSNVLNGTYILTAQAVDAAGYARSSAAVTNTVAPGGNSLVVNFDTQGAIANLSNYLAGNGLGVATNSPDTTVAAENENSVAGGGFVTASSQPNLLTQLGSNGPVSFTVDFSNSLAEFSFTRPELLANPFVTHPAWQVQAFDALGLLVDTISATQISSATNVPAETYTLSNTLDGAGIASVEFSSEGSGLTTFNAMLLDDFVLTTGSNLPPSVAIEVPTNGQVFTELTDLPILAAAVPGSGTIAGITYYANGAVLNSLSNLWNAPSNGTYLLTAVATNSLGLSSTSAPVSIAVSTSGFAIVAGPTNETVGVGNTAVFSVTATGSNISYQWQFNGNPVPGATLSSFTVNNAQSAAAGSYTVVLGSGGQTITSQPPAVLTVLGPPSINSVLPGTNVVVNLGGSITLSVNASETAGIPFYYQWQRNGQFIAGATNTSFTISNAQPSQSGNYQVLVANAVASQESPAFNVTVNFLGTNAPVTTNDLFADSLAINPTNGPVGGNNAASPTNGQLSKIANKPAGCFLWYHWTAGFTGVISLSTLGSSFDTLLGVYTGSNVTALASVAQDDDSAGFFDSLVTFNCVQGTTYQIAVAGYHGASGNVVLFSPGFLVLDANYLNAAAPFITQQPASQIVQAGATVTLSVTATNATTYQWYLNNAPVTGGSAATLVISNFPASAVGNYYVKAANGVGSVQSQVAAVQIQNAAQTVGAPNTLFEDKWYDAVDLSTTGTARYRPDDAGGDTGGFTLSQSFSTVGATKEEDEPNHAGQPGGASYWYSYTAPGNGTLQFNTAGSAFNTILAIYIGPGDSFATLTNVGAGYTTNYLLNGQPVVLVTNVTSGTKYFIAIDGYLGSSGAAHLNIITNKITNAIAAPSPVIITNNNVRLAFTSPANNYLTTSSNLTIRGTVKGVNGVQAPFLSYVQMAVNTNGFGHAALDATNFAAVLVTEPSGAEGVVAQETVTWSSNITLAPGLNLITAQSISAQSGNTESASVPVTLKVFLVPSLPTSGLKSTLTLQTSPLGSGKITGEPNQATLEINKAYTVTAAPIGSWIFTNWTAGTNANSVMGDSESLSFIMTSNLVLQANFITNPFPAVAGIYNGLFSSSNGVAEDSSGFFTATLPSSGRGAYSARLLVEGYSYPFSGTFDLSGDAEQTINRAGQTPLAVALHINLTAPDGQITGTVNDSTLLAERALSVPSTNFAGRFTLAIPPGTNGPAGYGYATLTNNPQGRVTLSGRLADNAALSQSVSISQNGNIPLYVSLYSRQGSLLGWLTVTNNPAKTILGTNLTWIKLPGKAGTLFAAGFTNTDISVLGSLYTAPLAGANNFTLTNGTLTISNGGLSGALIYSNLTVAGNKLANVNAAGNPPNFLEGDITPGTGVLTLKFRPTGAASDITAEGVVLQDGATTNAAGSFLGSDQSGLFLLQQ